MLVYFKKMLIIQLSLPKIEGSFLRKTAIIYEKVLTLANWAFDTNFYSVSW